MDVRVERTLNSIRGAFIQLLKEIEYENVTVQEISNVAGINRVTFYLHYFDKEDLLEQIMHNLLVELEENIIIPGEEFRYNLDQPVPTFIRMNKHILENEELYKIVLIEEKIPFYRKEIERLIKKSVRKAIEFYIHAGIEYTVPTEVVIAYISSAYYGVIKWWLKSNMPYSPEHLSSLLTKMATIGPYSNNPFNYNSL